MFTDGEFGTFYRSLEYSDNGNDLIRETDERGGTTEYQINGETSRVERIKDRCGNMSVYEYDENGRTKKVTNQNVDGVAIHSVAYAYDVFDNLIKTERDDGMSYDFGYNSYNNLEYIGVGGKDEALIRFVRKNKNARIKQVTYANGSTMKIVFNSFSQRIAEKWYNSENELQQNYRYVYDEKGKLVRTIDMSALKEYTYSNDVLVNTNEYSIAVNNDEVIIEKSLCNSCFYSYDTDSQLKRKRIVFADGEEQVVYYETSNGQTTAKFFASDKVVTAHSKTDCFGRKVFDELQLGLGFVSRQFSYHVGEVTDKHVADGKLKSTPTTSLVSRIELSDGRMLSYEYDAEERITKIVDSVDGTTEYTYDVMGQVLTESVNGALVNTMTYDNYGNILTKNGNVYTYGHEKWKDLLTKYGNQDISYDAQGNPTTYLGHTLVWEKGQQLKSYDNIIYTYKADGIRTSKMVNGVKHTYLLEGSKIVRETIGNVPLVPLYNNEESICGIEYNGVVYFFYKNLQGDVIAIVDQDGENVACYSYDVWGKCNILYDKTDCLIATINPFRYRGYYYDAESGFYYLQSRYYDPKIGRFINSDILVSNTGGNLYSYCNNNCVGQIDYNGTFSEYIYNLSYDQIEDFAHDVFNLAKKKDKSNTTGYDVASAIASGLADYWGLTTLAKISNAAGTVLLVYDVASSFFVTKTDEYACLFDLLYTAYTPYNHNELGVKFELRLLFGSHSNELLLVTYDKKAAYLYTCGRKSLIYKYSFVRAAMMKFWWNSAIGVFNDLLNELGVRCVKKNADWGYTYY